MNKIFTFIFITLISGTPVFSQDFIEVAQAQGILPGGCGLCSTGGGVSFADFNGDGLDDITFGTQDGDNILFYQNNGTSFDLLDPAPVTSTGLNKMILWFDMDNDGDKDLFVGNFFTPNQLYENDGNLNMTEITALAGLPIINDPTNAAAIGDYNNDGLLDIYVGNWSNSASERNVLYQNNGDNTFTNVNNTTGAGQNTNLTLATVFLDINNNGLQDIYSASDRYTDPNELLKNTCDQVFEDIGASSNSDIKINAMCVGVGDYDNDGDSDIYITNSPQGNQLLRNNGNETFSDVAAGVGVAMYKFTWGANFFDCDNDMDLDLYVSQSYLSFGNQFTRTLYINDIQAGNYNEAIAPGMAGDTLNSFANAIGDFNSDGRPDIVVSNSDFDGEAYDFQLWQNTTDNSNNWIKIFLVGTESNMDGIGSWIEVYVNGNKYVRYKHCGIGYQAQNSSVELIGLGSNTTIDSIKIKWLSSNVDVLYNVSANQLITIVETPSPTPFQCGCDYTAPAGASDAAICNGEDIPALAATVSAGLTVDWYDAPVGGNLLLSNSTSFVPPAAGTYYAEAIDPETGCFANSRAAATLTINQNPVADAGANLSTCLGTSITLTASATGGDGNYSYEWSGGAGTDQNFSVAPNVTTAYSLIITDGNGCSDSDMVTVTVLPFPLVNAGQDTTICKNECYSLSTAVTDGTAPYAYEWSGNGDTLVCPQTTTTYTVTVTDANNCTSVDAIKITVAAIPVVDTGVDTALCLGECITFEPMASEGEEPYSFSWSGDGSSMVCPDSSETYIVTVSDANNCTSTDSMEVTVNIPLAPITTDTAICQASCITFMANAYNLSSFETEGNSQADLTICETGTYQIEATDLNGCSTSMTITLSFIALPVADAGEDKTINCLETEVMIGGEGTSAGPGIIYEWSNGNTEATQVINQAGLYVLVVTDTVTGCISLADSVIIITDLESPIVDAGDDIMLTCAMLTATLNGEGSSNGPDFSYQWTTDNGNILNGANTLFPEIDSAGIYTLTVTNLINGCTATDSQTVYIAGMPVINLEEVINNLCYGDIAGAIDISASGGQPDYVFQWSNGAATEDITGLTAGQYEVTLVDGNSCELIMSFTVSSPEMIQIQFEVTDESASGANDGTVAAVTSGGTPDYNYAWSIGSGESMLSGLSPGWYFLTLTDINNCSVIDSAYVNNFECGTLGVESSGTFSICPGSTEGSISLDEITGGEAPYNILWSTGETSSTLSELSGGLYSCTLSDANNCNLILNFEITEQDIIPPTILLQDIVIFLDENGMASVTPEMIDAGSSDNCSEVSFSITNNTFECPATGTYALEVVLSDESNLMDTAMVNISILDSIGPVFINCPDDIITDNCLSVEYDLPVATDNCDGISYELTAGPASGETFPVGSTLVNYQATDAAGNKANCIFSVTVESTLAVNVELSPFTCDTLQPYAVMLLPEGGSPDYTYLWNDGNTSNNAIIALPGPWVWTVTDSQGCSLPGEINIQIPGAIEMTLVPTPETANQSNGAVDATISGGMPPYIFEWTNSTGTIVGNEQDLSDVSTDVYCLLVTDSNGCTLMTCDTVDQITQTIDQELSALIIISPNPASEKINISFDLPRQEEANLVLLDINGKFLKKTKKSRAADKVVMDISAYSNGIYLIKIIVEDRIAMKKILINK